MLASFQTEQRFAAQQSGSDLIAPPMVPILVSYWKRAFLLAQQLAGGRSGYRYRLW